MKSLAAASIAGRSQTNFRRKARDIPSDFHAVADAVDHIIAARLVVRTDSRTRRVRIRREARRNTRLAATPGKLFHCDVPPAPVCTKRYAAAGGNMKTFGFVQCLPDPWTAGRGLAAFKPLKDPHGRKEAALQRPCRRQSQHSPGIQRTRRTFGAVEIEPLGYATRSVSAAIH